MMNGTMRQVILRRVRFSRSISIECLLDSDDPSNVLAVFCGLALVGTKVKTDGIAYESI
jgi:hypothetical protein